MLTLASALPARAQDATWKSNAATFDFNTGSNWDTGTVPTGTAFFGASAQTIVGFSAGITNIGGLTLNSGASAYSFFNDSGHQVNFTGAGIVINGGSATLTNDGEVNFNNSSTAGSLAITNTKYVLFNDTSSAGSAAITNNLYVGFNQTSSAGSVAITNTYAGTLDFVDSSTAGSATITNDGYISFRNNSTAGSATITNNSFGGIIFWGNSTAGNARLITDSFSNINFSATTGLNNDNKVEAGSIEGGGNIDLGSNQLTVGSNNLSTQFSGLIHETGSGGSLVKAGTGTLTLSGANTYTGGTTFAGGTVSVSADANLGDAAGGLTFNGGALQITGTTFTSTARTITWGSGGGTLDIANAANTFTISQALTGSGGLTKAGAGKLILSGANTYSGVTTVNEGSLIIEGSIASSTINNNADSNIYFKNTSSAGTATINNNDYTWLSFLNTSSAGTATINNDNNAAVFFLDGATAGSATIFNRGQVYFDGTSTGGAAAITNVLSSSYVDFSFSSGPNGDHKLSVGSLAGGGGFYLGANELTIGSDNMSTNVTGVIADGAFGGGGGTGASLVKVGSGTLTLSGTNTYTGATTVDGGTLSVNGSIAASSMVTVNSGGTLGGTGTVGNATIASGGILAPGNSIGTLNVSGDLTFNSGATYAVEVSPTTADKTTVTGTATLTGATVNAIALSGSFSTRTYTILNATGNITGTFAGLTITGSFSPTRPTLTYDTNNVYLVLAPGVLTLTSGASNNQGSVASGINRAVEAGVTPPAGFDTLLNMSGTQLSNALDQVSGQAGGGSQQAAFNAGQQFVTTMIDPFAGGRGGGATSGVGALGYAEEDEAYASADKRAAYAAVTPRDRMRAGAFEERWGVWATGYGGTSTVSGSTSAGTASTTSRVYGTVVGADYKFSPNTQIGFAAGGAGFTFGLSNGLGGGRADLFQIGGFGRHSFGAAYVSGALAYGWQDVTTDRTVTVSGTDMLRANYKANTITARGEAGYRFAPIAGDTFGLAPYIALQMNRFSLRGYSETAVSGSNQFALTYAPRTATTLRTELGARADKSYRLTDTLLTLRGRLAWAHDSNNDNTVSAAFQSISGSNFTVNGATPAKNAALVTAESELKWRNGFSLAGTFEGEFSSTTRSYLGKGTVRYAW